MKIVRFMGGLGNQMFQYALYRKLQYLNQSVKADVGWFGENIIHNGFEISKIFRNIDLEIAAKDEISSLSDISNGFFNVVRRKILRKYKTTHYKEKGLFFQPEVFEMADNLYLDGYWQSEKYFFDIRNLLLEEFKFPKIESEYNRKILDIIENSNSVSIHVRRGDYLNNNIYSNICSEKYYKSAINLIMKRINEPVFFIFSDDIEWCKERLFSEREKNIHFVDNNQGENSFIDMQLISLCKYNIIANSSFSWWGAWLNNYKNKIVIAPEKWVNIKKSKINDILPSDWIKI